MELHLHSHTGLRGVRKDKYTFTFFLLGHTSSQKEISCTQSLFTPVADDPVGAVEIRTLVEPLLGGGIPN